MVREYEYELFQLKYKAYAEPVPDFRSCAPGLEVSGISVTRCQGLVRSLFGFRLKSKVYRVLENFAGNSVLWKKGTSCMPTSTVAG